jgi:hypothetical protein
MTQKIVSYGDLVTFQWGSKLGYLGSQSEYQASNSLYHSLKLSTHQFELVTYNRPDKEVNQNFDEEILAGCVFQIITDDGKDFDGVPVKYGSEINLKLRRSGHRMHTTKGGQDALDFGSGKTFGFRFNPKFKFNAERQYVLYEDLIIFTEHTGKNLLVEESKDSPCKVSFASYHRSTPFRIHYFGVESKPDERDVKTLMFSDIIQLFHNEAGGFAAAERHVSAVGTGPAAHANNGRDPLSHDKVSSAGIMPHIKRKSNKQYEASTLWQIESNVGHDKEVPVGKLKSSAPIRLRHVLTDTYLNVSFKREKEGLKKGALTDVQLDLNSNPLESTLFTCVVLPHGSLESISNSVGKSSGLVELQSMSNIRICNVQTSYYVVAEDDSQHSDESSGSDHLPMTASEDNFDGDIFRITTVPAYIVQDVFILKVFSRALTKQLLEMEKMPGNPENISRAVHLLLKLMQKDQAGVLLDRNLETDIGRLNSRQQVT